MIVRLGIPSSFGRFCGAAQELGASMMVSANAMRRKDRGFRVPKVLSAIAPDVALDSAGFVAMVRYGGYPWSVSEYVALAAAHPWAWWASMDFCCEPETLKRRGLAVADCIRETVLKLRDCQTAADNREAAHPMPVLQGWSPSDYLRCFDQMQAFPLPDLIGVGSVCRRSLGGADGLMRVLASLDAGLPPRFVFHLFGVKGAAIRALAGHPRVHSLDSMGWDFAARREKKPGQSCTVAYRISHMRRWYGQQSLAQGLFGGLRSERR